MSQDSSHSSAISSIYTFAELGAAQPPQCAPLATECALAISYNGLNQAVMMVSPRDLEDFVVGFSLSNGTISQLDELYDLRVAQRQGAWHAELQISSRAFWNLK